MTVNQDVAGSNPAPGDFMWMGVEWSGTVRQGVEWNGLVRYGRSLTAPYFYGLESQVRTILPEVKAGAPPSTTNTICVDVK